jgi:hypothetical protein
MLRDIRVGSCGTRGERRCHEMERVEDLKELRFCMQRSFELIATFAYQEAGSCH